MTSQTDRPEQEQQASEEPESEPLTGDPDFPVAPDFSGFYRGSMHPGDMGSMDENYLMRTRFRAIQSWGQEGTWRRAKGFFILLGIVGGVLIAAMLLLT
ncbi:MAG: hypothetical protein F4045_00070 [Chloroflexi bacterium]|nr:hypothetical protein [Chloroflexota bacterium]MYK33541.1 hypothetical protein [Chloroflexota bacterium]